MSVRTSAQQPPAGHTEVPPGAGAVPGGPVPDQAEEERAQHQAEELLREHDVSARYRTNLGWWAWLIGIISVVFTAYHLYAAFERPYNTWMHSALHLAGGTALIFLLYPVSKKLLRPRGRKLSALDVLIGWHRGVPWYDAALAGAAAFVSLYVFFNYGELVSNRINILGYDAHMNVIAALGVILVLEATRRCVGLPIVVIAGLAVLYAIYGDRLPAFSHAGQSWDTFATNTFLSSGQGIFGTPIQVSANFIFLFLFFAVVLLRTNIGQFFNDLAFRATGRFSGGPAKAAVGASGLQGMVSGSSVANTVASGSFTIPIMKKAGFKPHVAAATEATASTGGQIMPPIMGAAAFIMAQNVTGIEYNQLIVVAIIPALLYFLGVFFSIHFYAKRNMLKGLPPEELPSWRSLLTRIDMLLPLVVIVGTLVSGMSPMRAALFGIGTAMVISLIRAFVQTFWPSFLEAQQRGGTSEALRATARMLWLMLQAVIDMFIAGARTALPVIAACAAAGIVAGTVTSTGLGGQLGAGLIELAGGNFLLVLFFVMIACIILGMGLPTTANYVVTATIAAPILYTNFDVPLIAAHMFVFFFGILADVTPPVCLAAFAGAGIANANPMATGLTAVKIAFAGFLIPYAFILQPALLLPSLWDESQTLGDHWFDTLLYLGMTIVGIAALAAAIAGYLLTRAGAIERILLAAGGLLLIYPDVYVSLAGVGAVVLAVVMQVISRSKDGMPHNGPETDSHREPAQVQPAQ